MKLIYAPDIAVGVDLAVTLGNPFGEGESAVFELPLSKSMAARVITCCWLAGKDLFDKLLPRELPDCEDTLYIKDAFDRVTAGDAEVWLGDGGTTLRFFLSAVASTPGVEVALKYSEQLAARPIAPLLNALTLFGADVIGDKADEGYIKVYGRELTGGTLEIDGGVSSQFISALMMAAPGWRNGLRMTICGKLVSRPYVEMTARVMESMGVSVTIEGDTVLVPGGGYKPMVPPEIETDRSAAMVVYELGMVLPERRIRVSSLTPPEKSVQGDARCEKMFSELGVKTLRHSDGSVEVMGDSRLLERSRLRSKSDPLIFDMGDYPDVVPYLVVGMCLAGINFRIENVAHLHHKESDRIMVLKRNLENLGYNLQCGADYLSWSGDMVGKKGSGVTNILTYDDHRMCMAFAPAAVVAPVLIDNPSAVKKSFPDFWNQLAKFGFRSEGDCNSIKNNFEQPLSKDAKLKE